MGTVIKIKGANFSGSPLGKVTSYEVKALQVATAYCTSISDNTHIDSIYNFVLELLKNDLWDKMNYYPMLGSSLASKLINLNPDEGFGGHDLTVGANASSVENYIHFVQTTNPGAIEVHRTSNVVMNGFYICADMQRIEFNPNTSLLYAPYSGYKCDFGGFGGLGTSQTGNVGFTINSAINESVPYTNNAARKLVSAQIFQDENEETATSDLYADTVKVGEIDTLKDARTTTNYNPGVVFNIGAKSEGSNTQEMFDGNCWFFAIGFVDNSKRELADSIIKAFLDAVKPRS